MVWCDEFHHWWLASKFHCTGFPWRKYPEGNLPKISLVSFLSFPSFLSLIPSLSFWKELSQIHQKPEKKQSECHCRSSWIYLPRCIKFHAWSTIHSSSWCSWCLCFFSFFFFFFCIFVIFVILLFFPLFIHFFFHFSHSISHILHSSQKIDEPCVKAHLIDARGVEKIILIPTYNEARTVIYEDKPRNVDSCYTIEAEQLQSRSGSAMYFGMTSGGKGRFFDDVDQQIRFVSSLFSSSFPLSPFFWQWKQI